MLTAVVAAATSCGGSNQKQADSADDQTTKADSTLSSWSAGVPTTAADGDEARKGKFDEQQVQVVLARAAKNAHTCVDIAPKDQPRGDATVTVTFSGKGRSTAATIAPPFEGTTIGQCATRAFVDIIVPPFDGPDVQRPQQVDLKPTAAKEGKKKGAAKPGGASE